MARFFSRNWLVIWSVMIDGLAITLALVMAFSLRNNWLLNYFPPTQDFTIYWQALPWIIITLTIVFYSFGLYHRANRQSSLIESGLMIKATTFWLICLMALAYLVKYEYSRLIMIQLWFWALLSLTIGRVLVKQIKNQLINFRWFQIPVLVVGRNSYSQEIVKKLLLDKSYKFVDFFDGQPSDLYQLIKAHHIQEVFLADDQLSAEKFLQIIDDCPERQIKFRVAANLFPLVQNYIWSQDKINLLPFVELNDLPEIDLSRAGGGWFYLFSKRLIDIVVSGISLILLSPFFFLLAWLIRKDSAGQSLIAQDRVGKNGKVFKMFKFRTMFNDVPLYQVAPVIKDDVRITRVGKILRRFSLDELPQIYNVFKGEMSLVGPRPEMPFIVAQYNSWQMRRLIAKPGLTGLWQILGRKDIPLQENLQYDFYYINNQSILLDLSIIIKTIPLVIKGQGAF